MTHDRMLGLMAWARQRLNQPDLTLQLISGDASFRRYYRAAGRIWVDAPPTTEKNREFVRNALALTQAGIRAPQVEAVDYSAGWLCVSDLGDTSLFSQLQSDTVAAWYAKAIAVLPRLAKITLPLDAFDRAFMARENTIFPEWLLEHHLGLNLTPAEKQLLATTFERLGESNLAQTQVVMHRDYHSRNLMVCGDGELAVIDFQDMVQGPLSYDLVSLLKDCYVRWPEQVVADGVAQAYRAYADADLLSGYSADEFRLAFDWCGMQRHLKAAGIFTRLHHRDGKSGYLADIPRTLGYVAEVAAASRELQDFADWLGHRVLPAFVSQEPV
ncbi:aminoglycoside phosphotransferase family protein [Pseudaeromonas sharmana]|uniref:Aminoglycoside phosphotransferase family protein n=1 Tax=Pseudaeromonas sharmana TaxID=328412 RepID=A0ABV8CLM8_9GAMM